MSDFQRLFAEQGWNWVYPDARERAEMEDAIRGDEFLFQRFVLARVNELLSLAEECVDVSQGLRQRGSTPRPGNVGHWEIDS